MLSQPTHPALFQQLHNVAEGDPTARSAFRLARERGVVTPIIDEVYAMVHEDKDVRQAVQDVINRESKAED